MVLRNVASAWVVKRGDTKCWSATRGAWSHVNSCLCHIKLSNLNLGVSPEWHAVLLFTCSLLINYPIGPTPDDSLNNQLVTPPDGNRSTFDVTYLRVLTDKWLGWAPLQNEQSVCNKPSKQPSFGDIHVPLHGGKLLPPVVPVFKFIVLLLLLLLAGDIESNPGPGMSFIAIYLYAWSAYFI